MADGSVILGEISGKKVTRVAPDGRKTEIGKAGGGPNGVATGPDGALYVCNNGGAVYETTPSFLSTGPAPDYKNGSIQRIDLKTGETKTLYTECNGHKLSAPNESCSTGRAGSISPISASATRITAITAGSITRCRPARKSSSSPIRCSARTGSACRRTKQIVYFADTESSRLFAFDIVEPGVVKKEHFPAPFGGRLVCGLPGFQRFDSLALEASGNICVATLNTGHITVISPSGQVVRQVKMPDVYPTNICFGGTDLRTAYITLSASGQLAAMQWPEPGLKLNFMC